MVKKQVSESKTDPLQSSSESKTSATTSSRNHQPLQQISVPQTDNQPGGLGHSVSHFRTFQGAERIHFSSCQDVDVVVYRRQHWLTLRTAMGAVGRGCWRAAGVAGDRRLSRLQTAGKNLTNQSRRSPTQRSPAWATQTRTGMLKSSVLSEWNLYCQTEAIKPLSGILVLGQRNRNLCTPSAPLPSCRATLRLVKQIPASLGLQRGSTISASPVICQVCTILPNFHLLCFFKGSFASNWFSFTPISFAALRLDWQEWNVFWR